MSDRGRGGESRGGRGGARGPPPRRDGAPETPQVDNLLHRTRIKEELTEKFNEDNIEFGSTDVDEKLPPGECGKERRQFLINAFGVKTENVPIYQYKITIDGLRKPNDPKPVYLTKQQSDDCIASDRRARCRDAFKLMLKVAFDVFHRDNHYFYDLQSTLLTTKTFIQNGEERSEFRFTIGPPQLDNLPLLNKFHSLNYHIKRCNVENPLTTGDMSMATLKNFEDFNRSHQAFIELATSKRALLNPAEIESFRGGKFYLIQPENYVDPSVADAANQFAPDKYIGMGCKKSAKYVEGPKGRGSKNVALFIAPIKTPFYRSMKVIELLARKNINPRSQDAFNALRSLHVYNPHRSGKVPFQITNIRDSAGNYTFKNRDGRVLNVVQYFYEAYGVNCDPSLPLVCGKGSKDILPMDVALIDDNQPVPKNKMAQAEDRKMIKLAAQPPSNQIEEINGHMKALGLNKLNINDDTIRLIEKPLKVEGRILQNPEIVYGEGKASVVPGVDGTWHLPKNSYRGGSFKAWAIIHNGRGTVDLNQFEAAYVRQCRNMNMNLPDRAAYHAHGNGDFDELERQFQEAKQRDIDFIVFITDEVIKHHYQSNLKLFELRYEITTQNIKTTTACDCYSRGTATLQNIVNKTNVKNGGLNNSIKVHSLITDGFGNNCIVIGIALSHAGSIDAIQQARGGIRTADKLTSIGYAANTGKDFYEFFGDHVPNTAYRSEIMDCIPGIIEKTLAQYHENKGFYPSTMVLYLNGSSEGEFSMLLRFEVPLVRKAIKDVVGHEIPVTVVIPLRSHVARIYKSEVNKEDKAAQQNIQPGVVIDTGLVHPAINEFYLNSHAALLGTARTPKYTIIFNNNTNMKMDNIQRLTYDLCYAYQIVNSPVSLPASVYIAQQYAKRGSMLYSASGISDASEAALTLRYDNVEKFRNRRLNA